jgi:hypothetical protein
MPFCCKIYRPAWRLTVFATCLASMLLESLHVHCHPLSVGPSFGGGSFRAGFGQIELVLEKTEYSWKFSLQ